MSGKCDVILSSGVRVWSTFDSGNLEKVKELNSIDEMFEDNDRDGDNDDESEFKGARKQNNVEEEDGDDDDDEDGNNCNEGQTETMKTHLSPTKTRNTCNTEVIICGSVRPDSKGLWKQKEMKTWFYFRVSEIPANISRLTFCIRNMNKQLRLYKQGLEPVVYRQYSQTSNGMWGRFCCDVEADYEDERFSLIFSYELTPKHTPSTLLAFAFCYPFSYDDLQHQLSSWESHFSPERDLRRGDIYFHREVVCKSVQNRNVDLITISSWDAEQAVTRAPRIKPLFPVLSPTCTRPFTFPSRKIFFLSARVHPGETPGSHVCNGTLKFLLDKDDPRAQLLREMFVFKIIPMLNPDGVSIGNYRCDSQGLNLNRFYNNPSFDLHPSIYASKCLTLYYSHIGRLQYYIDTHGHATKRGCFFYGNCLESSRHIDSVLYAKLVALNTPHLDFMACNFSEKNMFSKDKRDGLSKEGSGRVGTFFGSDITYCYTLECNYNTGRLQNEMAPSISDLYHIETYPMSSNIKPYTPGSWEDVGRALVVAALDIQDKNPCSRIPLSEFGSFASLKSWVKSHIKSSHKFKSSSQSCRGKISARRRSHKDSVDELMKGIVAALTVGNTKQRAKRTPSHTSRCPRGQKRVFEAHQIKTHNSQNGYSTSVLTRRIEQNPHQLGVNVEREVKNGEEEEEEENSNDGICSDFLASSTTTSLISTITPVVSTDQASSISSLVANSATCIHKIVSDDDASALSAINKSTHHSNHAAFASISQPRLHNLHRPSLAQETFPTSSFMSQGMMSPRSRRRCDTLQRTNMVPTSSIRIGGRGRNGKGALLINNNHQSQLHQSVQNQESISRTMDIRTRHTKISSHHKQRRDKITTALLGTSCSMRIPKEEK
eukprot:m.131213 g.131213  ORF g.131213 m.131213 type:complete len:884 (+) comp9476_c1_seq6:34-2685(+)